MSFFNKLYWVVVCLLAGGTAYFAANPALNTPTPGRQKTGLEQAVEKEISKKRTTLEETKESCEETKPFIPIFKGYENPELQRYDKTVLEAIEFWNEFFKAEKNYTKPPVELVKKIILVETAWGGIPTKDFYKDPMQVYKDFAHRVVAKEGGEGLFPVGGVPELRNMPLDARTSILCGVGWLIHKAAKYSFDGENRYIKSMNYKRAVEMYNGGGDPRYVEKVNSLKAK